MASRQHLNASPNDENYANNNLILKENGNSVETILSVWDKVWNASIFVWDYSQMIMLDLLSGQFNQETIGLLLMLGGMGALILMFIFSVFASSRKMEDSNDIMACLMKHSIIKSTTRNTIKGVDMAPKPELTYDLKMIETDMKALKELYEAGRIKSELYISESRNLYETAKDIYSG
ncbi:MAG: hypothetical protein ACPHRC_08515 [Candidatus Puniceispirillales bacterium]